jgi:nitroimidazol reductase NimA-like FMN-containing flavoprotein (pyridoxamine 5'-phosphate oxidase superfamily)
MDVEKLVRENTEGLFHMSLATSSGNAPWVCEVHFAYDESLNLYFRSLLSRRHSQEISKNPQVAGNIVKQSELGESPVGVYFEGRAELLSGVDLNHPAFLAISQRIGVGSEIIDEANKEDGHKFYKITVKNWYVFGRFGTDHSQKLKLEWNK